MSTEGTEKAKAAATKPSKLSAAIANEKAAKSGDNATSNSKSAESSASNTAQPTATTTAPLSSQVGETKVDHGTTESGETVITPDPSDQSIAHPLHNRWSLYYTGPAAGKSAKAKGEDAAAAWASNVRKVMDFDTVEAFWGLFNNLQPPSHLAQKTDYHLFKDEIKPSWEDKANAKGGKWTIEYPASRLEDLNKAWTYTVLAMIGEQFEDTEEICGAVVGIRKGKSRIQLWTKTATSEQAQLRIGGSLKKFTEAHGKIDYQAHNAEGTKFRDGGSLYQV